MPNSKKVILIFTSTRGVLHFNRQVNCRVVAFIFDLAYRDIVLVHRSNHLVQWSDAGRLCSWAK